MNERAVDLAPKQTVEAVMDAKRLGRMLDAYYELNGWDAHNGFPLPATLEKLGLGYVESHLEQKRASAMTAELPESCRLPLAT